MYAVRLSSKMGEIIMMMMRATGRGDGVDSIIACSQREVDKDVRYKQEWLIQTEMMSDVERGKIMLENLKKAGLSQGEDWFVVS